MDSSTNTQSKESAIKNETTHSPEFIEISETAIPEYLEVVKKEYEIERGKKQSFESRAGLIITVIAAISVFLFERVKFSELTDLMSSPLTFYILVKIVAGIAVYLGFILTVIMIFRTVSVKEHDNFEVKSIDEELLRENRIEAICRLIFTYRNIIVQHRTVNGKRATSYKNALYGIVSTIFCVIIYISL